MYFVSTKIQIQALMCVSPKHRGELNSDWLSGGLSLTASVTALQLGCDLRGWPLSALILLQREHQALSLRKQPRAEPSAHGTQHSCVQLLASLNYLYLRKLDY